MMLESERKERVRKYSERFWNGQKDYWVSFQWSAGNCVTNSLGIFHSVGAYAFHCVYLSELFYNFGKTDGNANDLCP